MTKQEYEKKYEREIAKKKRNLEREACRNFKRALQKRVR